MPAPRARRLSDGGAIQSDAIRRYGAVIFAGCCRWRQWSWVGRGLSSRRPSRRLFGLSARRAYIEHARRATRRRAASGAVGRRSDERFRSRPTRSAVLQQGLAIVQLVGASAEIAMAGSHRRMLVIDFGGLAISGERPQDGVETPAFERVLLRLQNGAARGRVGRDRFGGDGQVFANMIEINQIAALVAELLLDLPDDPWRAVADRVNP